MKVVVVTGSRSDWGILLPVVQALRADARFSVQVVATGSHLSPEFGLTVREIEADGVPVHAQVEMLLSSDTGVGMAKALGLGVIGFADTLAQLRPDWVLALGDRFEIFAAAQACLMLGIPLAHLGGGDVTEGAVDEAMRHAITKIAHLHLVTHEDAARCVRQLGEEPHRVHVVGNPGLDTMASQPVPSLQQMAAAGYAVTADDLLVVLHPETLDSRDPLAVARPLTAALEALAPPGIWLVLPNADAQGRELAAFLRDWAGGQPHVHAYTSLPRRWFLGLMAHCRAMAGNSSSALAEAPTLGLPAVDIGRRQAGRLAGDSVLRCEPVQASIEAALRQAMALRGRRFANPYGDGRSSQRIVQLLGQAQPPRDWLVKRFQRLPAGAQP